MTNLATLSNHQIRLAARPVGLPKRDGWSFTTESVTEPAANGIVVKTLSLSLDPAMRGWMNEGKSYIPPVGIGEVMRAGGIGKVIATANPKFAVGDTVTCSLGVQEYAAFDEVGIKRGGLAKIDLRVGSINQWHAEHVEPLREAACAKVDLHQSVGLHLGLRQVQVFLDAKACVDMVTHRKIFILGRDDLAHAACPHDLANAQRRDAALAFVHPAAHGGVQRQGQRFQQHAAFSRLGHRLGGGAPVGAGGHADGTRGKADLVVDEAGDGGCGHEYLLNTGGGTDAPGQTTAIVSGLTER